MKFQDMPYERPDADAVKKAYEEAAEKLLKAETYGEARSAFLEVPPRSILETRKPTGFA